jgi:hypothetical protein
MAHFFLQGFPPPLLKRVVLNQSVIDDISNCREGKRPYLITFSGNVRSPVRKQLRDFVHNGKDVLILYGTQMRDLGLEYEDMVLRSKFGAAPAGESYSLFDLRIALCSIAFCSHPFISKATTNLATVLWKSCLEVRYQFYMQTTWCCHLRAS